MAVTTNSEALWKVLRRIKRGLSGYVSYLAACEMNGSFSEYVLYEPILRILMTCQFSVACEYECPGIDQSDKRGDKKRLDFYAARNGLEFGLEVKWARTKRIDVSRDIEKLNALRTANPKAVPLLCVFGRKSLIEALVLTEGQHWAESGTAVIAEFGQTRYGCRIFELRGPLSAAPQAR